LKGSVGYSGRFRWGNEAEHDRLRIARRTSTVTHKNDVFATNHIEYVMNNSVINELTKECLQSVIEVNICNSSLLMSSDIFGKANDRSSPSHFILLNVAEYWSYHYD
jgi:hypothetical protein